MALTTNRYKVGDIVILLPSVPNIGIHRRWIGKAGRIINQNKGRFQVRMLTIIENNSSPEFIGLVSSDMVHATPFMKALCACE